jgi:hypothetical protein
MSIAAVAHMAMTHMSVATVAHMAMTHMSMATATRAHMMNMCFILETTDRTNLYYFAAAYFINFVILREFSYTFTFAFWSTTFMYRQFFFAALHKTNLLYFISMYYM